MWYAASRLRHFIWGRFIVVKIFCGFCLPGDEPQTIHFMVVASYNCHLIPLPLVCFIYVLYCCRLYVPYVSSDTPGCAACALVTGAPSACVRTSSTQSCCRWSGPNSTLSFSEGPNFLQPPQTLIASQIWRDHHPNLVPFISTNFLLIIFVFIYIVL